MPSQTTIHGLPYPVGSDQGLSIDDTMKLLAEALDARLTPLTSGTLSARPPSSPATPGKAGRRYYATDVGVEYVDLGTRWRVAGGHTGAIVETLRATAIDGYLMCDGQGVTTAHADLRGHILALNSPWGTDSGNPRLPDHQGRGGIGAGQGTGLSARTLGQLIGTETHTLTLAETPAHEHEAALGGLFVVSAGVPLNVAGSTPGSGSNYSHQQYTNAKGGGQPHTNIQPSLVVNYMVQT